jgi:hypothetical protein
LSITAARYPTIKVIMEIDGSTYVWDEEDRQIRLEVDHEGLIATI